MLRLLIQTPVCFALSRRYFKISTLPKIAGFPSVTVSSQARDWAASCALRETKCVWPNVAGGGQMGEFRGSEDPITL